MRIRTVPRLPRRAVFAKATFHDYLGCMRIPSIKDIREEFKAGNGKEARQRLMIDGFQQAGVLVPIIQTAEGPLLLMTKRTEQVETHKGQISFPGGMADSTDKDIVDTALREAYEEVGIPNSSIETIGLLDDLPTPTGFVITPVVGIIKDLPPLTPNRNEVAEILYAPLDFFIDGKNARTEQREWRGQNHEIWFYQFGEHLIWGATATITRSLLKKLRLI